jgi:glycerol-3-phosphate responsive antiterminator
MKYEKNNNEYLLLNFNTIYIHVITVHIIRIKPFIDTVKKSSKKNLYYVSYFMSA